MCSRAGAPRDWHGLTHQLPHGFELSGSLGWDWLVVDLQHGLLDYSDMVPMLQALSITNTVPFVRVPWRDTWQIDRALDAGKLS